jgi:hypothetical protein
MAWRISNTNVGFVNLLRRYDRLWMNRRVRSVNLRLDRALMRHECPTLMSLRQAVV